MACKCSQLAPELIPTILDSIADGVFTIDRDWRITSFNRAAQEITGIPCSEALGQLCSDVFRGSICNVQCALRRSMEQGRPVVDTAVYITNAEGRRIPVSVSSSPLKNAAGETLGGVETFRDLSQIQALRQELTERHAFEGIISRDREMQAIFEIIPDIAASNATVLIEGESGTGKELFARAIHQLSPRGKAPFVALNCGALPDSLLESELFGYRAGAFTDARTDKPGRFALAEGGTLFLDEIGDVSAALQVRLLRVLQERVYTPLGSNEPVRANVRILAATNKPLAAEVEAGRFRQDLFYRVNVIRIVVPPLRRRREDVPLLAEHILENLNRVNGYKIVAISPGAMSMLAAYDFPGNVRELENIIEHAFVLSPGGTIEPEHLPDTVRKTGRHNSPTNDDAAPGTLVDGEKRMIEDALIRNDYNRLAAARELGIHKSTLFRKLHRFGIRLPDRDGRSSPKG